MTRQKGFTLIELLLVIALFSVVALGSFGFYSTMIQQNVVYVTDQQLKTQLRKAQNYSISSYQNSNWGVYYNPPSLTLYRGNNYASRVTSYDEVLNISPLATVTGLSEINFSRKTGTSSATPSIRISAGTFQKILRVESSGTINE